MNNKREIVKKYSLFMKVKKMIIILGIISSLSLMTYLIMRKNEVEIITNFILVISIISIVIFLLLWISLIPMKKHIVGLIEENDKNG